MSDRGNWPHGYGVCRMSDGARSDLARWAFYNLGAFMCSRTPGLHYRPETLDQVWAHHFARCAELPGTPGNDVCNVWN
jgi:hypothetical protein